MKSQKEKNRLNIRKIFLVWDCRIVSHERWWKSPCLKLLKLDWKKNTTQKVYWNEQSCIVGVKTRPVVCSLILTLLRAFYDNSHKYLLWKLAMMFWHKWIHMSGTAIFGISFLKAVCSVMMATNLSTLLSKDTYQGKLPYPRLGWRCVEM